MTDSPDNNPILAQIERILKEQEAAGRPPLRFGDNSAPQGVSLTPVEATLRPEVPKPQLAPATPNTLDGSLAQTGMTMPEPAALPADHYVMKGGPAAAEGQGKSVKMANSTFVEEQFKPITPSDVPTANDSKEDFGKAIRYFLHVMANRPDTNSPAHADRPENKAYRDFINELKAEINDPVTAGLIKTEPDPILYIAKLVDEMVEKKIKYEHDITPQENNTFQTPEATAAKWAGDCEDEAILKAQALRDLGVPKENVYVAILQGQDMRGSHAVTVVVGKDGTPYVLDQKDGAKLTKLDDYLKDKSGPIGASFVMGVITSDNKFLKNQNVEIDYDKGRVKVYNEGYDYDRGDKSPAPRSLQQASPELTQAVAATATLQAAPASTEIAALEAQLEALKVQLAQASGPAVSKPMAFGDNSAPKGNDYFGSAGPAKIDPNAKLETIQFTPQASALIADKIGPQVERPMVFGDAGPMGGQKMELKEPAAPAAHTSPKADVPGFTGGPIYGGLKTDLPGSAPALPTDANGRVKFDLGNGSMTPEQVSAELDKTAALINPAPVQEATARPPVPKPEGPAPEIVQTSQAQIDAADLAAKEAMGNDYIGMRRMQAPAEPPMAFGDNSAPKGNDYFGSAGPAKIDPNIMNEPPVTFTAEQSALIADKIVGGLPQSERIQRFGDAGPMGGQTMTPIEPPPPPEAELPTLVKGHLDAGITATAVNLCEKGVNQDDINRCLAGKNETATDYRAVAERIFALVAMPSVAQTLNGALPQLQEYLKELDQGLRDMQVAMGMKPDKIAPALGTVQPVPGQDIKLAVSPPAPNDPNADNPYMIKNNPSMGLRA